MRRDLARREQVRALGVGEVADLKTFCRRVFSVELGPHEESLMCGRREKKLSMAF